MARTVLTDRKNVLALLERATSQGQVLYTTGNTLDGVELAVGPPDTDPAGTLVSLEVLRELREEGLATSWLADPLPGNGAGEAVWYFGEMSFEGPGLLNGERQ